MHCSPTDVLGGVLIRRLVAQGPALDHHDDHVGLALGLGLGCCWAGPGSAMPDSICTGLATTRVLSAPRTTGSGRVLAHGVERGHEDPERRGVGCTSGRHGMPTLS